MPGFTDFARGYAGAKLGHVLLDLRRGTDLDAVLDRERMKMEHVLQKAFRFLGSGIFQIDPEEQIRIRQQRRHEKDFQTLTMQTPLRIKSQRPYHVLIARHIVSHLRRDAREGKSV